MLKRVLILLFCSVFPAVCFSEKKKPKDRKVVEINFDDELLIKGKLMGPSLFTLYQKRSVKFGKLIKPRKNFLPEMRAAIGDIE